MQELYQKFKKLLSILHPCKQVAKQRQIESEYVDFEDIPNVKEKARKLKSAIRNRLIFLVLIGAILACTVEGNSNVYQIVGAILVFISAILFLNTKAKEVKKFLNDQKTKNDSLF